MMFSRASSCPPSTLAGTDSFSLAVLSIFSLPICRKEGDQKDGWYDKIKSDFLTVRDYLQL